MKKTNANATIPDTTRPKEVTGQMESNPRSFLVRYSNGRSETVRADSVMLDGDVIAFKVNQGARYYLRTVALVAVRCVSSVIEQNAPSVPNGTDSSITSG